MQSHRLFQTENGFVKKKYLTKQNSTFLFSTSIITLIISIISCSSEPIFSSNNPAVRTENKHKYCLLWSVFVSTFAIGTTAVVDGDEDDDDVIDDSNVVGECVRTRLQFRFNSAVIVSFESEEEIRDMMMEGRDTILLGN
jgi:hypothetical protein